MANARIGLPQELWEIFDRKEHEASVDKIIGTWNVGPLSFEVVDLECQVGRHPFKYSVTEFRKN